MKKYILFTINILLLLLLLQAALFLIYIPTTRDAYEGLSTGLGYPMLMNSWFLDTFMHSWVSIFFIGCAFLLAYKEYIIKKIGIKILINVLALVIFAGIEYKVLEGIRAPIEATKQAENK